MELGDGLPPDRGKDPKPGEKWHRADEGDTLHGKKASPPNASIQHTYVRPGYENGSDVKYSESDVGPFVIHVSRGESDQLNSPTPTRMRALKMAQIIYNGKVAGIKEVKSIGQNKMSVYFHTAKEANSFLAEPILKSHNLTAAIPRFQVSRMGVVRQIPLDWTLEEFSDGIECPPGSGPVIKARRLNTKKIVDGQKVWEPTGTVVITFLGQKLPEKVYCFNMSIPVDIYRLPIIQCHKCCRFGHIKDQCRSNPRCSRCSQPHETSTCTVPDSEVSCMFCAGQHTSTDPKCPEFSRQRSIKLVMSEENIGYVEAARRFRPVRTSYAEKLSQPIANSQGIRSPRPHQSMSQSQPLPQTQSYRKTVQIERRPRPEPELPKSTSNRIVSILGLFELSVGSSPRVEGASELAAAQLAVQHVNQRGLLPGYRLHLITNDTKCDPGVGVDRFFHALYTERESRMVMLLGTACSEVTESIAKIVPYWNIVQVSFGATSPALSDRSEFPLFCRTVAPDSSHNPARIAFIRQFGWDTVTAFSQNEEVYSLAVNELVTQLEAANITCAASITFAESDFKEQLQQLKELDTRIIIGSFSQEMIPKIFCEAFKLGMWGAEYAWVVAGAPPRLRAASPCARSQLAAALEGLVSVTAPMRGDRHESIVGDAGSYSTLSNELFHREMEAAGVPVSPYAPQTYDAVWAIALTLSKAEQLWRSLDMTHYNGTLLKGGAKLGLSHFDYNRKDMAEEFLNQLANLSFLGVSGPVSFNGADRIGTSAFYQIQGGRPKLVALYTSGRQLSCVWCARAAWGGGGGVPAARRVLVLRIDSVWAPARLAVAALAAAGVMLAVGFLVFNLHYSKRRSIKLSSPRLNNMTLIGCVLVYTAVALLGVDNATLPSYVPFSAMCTGRVYILSAGFSLAFGSMFAKTYRVHRIFISNRSGVCKTKLLQDTPLISLVCALLVLDGLIVTLWAALDPMQRQLKNLTREISASDRSVVYQPQIEVCKSQNTTGWLCALYAYKGLLLLVGVYMAWETRHVKISALNDSKYIGISVYSVVITSTSVVVIGTIISERATLAYITITSLILITTTSTLCLLFLPKIVAIRSKTEDDPVIQSLGLRLECKTRRFVTDETQELHFRIEIQNKVYKREVAALDKEIGRLERLLAEPLESTSSSTASIALHKRTELNTVEEEGRCRSNPDRRTPSITGGLPMLLLSVLPPVIPRASWPSAEHCRGRNSVSFSSQPKLNYRKSQPAIDLYSLCLNKREEHQGLLSRLKSFFGGSRPQSRKASTMSIADPTGQSIAAALKMHVGMIAGFVPGNRKHSMVLSCNTLNVPYPELKLRRESYAKSGPIIRITDDEPTCSKYERAPQKYVAEPETKVNFVLPTIHKTPMSHENSCEKIKGSPRFPHRISPAASSLTTLRKTSADSVFSITGKTFDEQRRYSHQNVSNQEPKGKTVLESRWKSTEDARPGPSSRN